MIALNRVGKASSIAFFSGSAEGVMEPGSTGCRAVRKGAEDRNPFCESLEKILGHVYIPPNYL